MHATIPDTLTPAAPTPPSGFLSGITVLDLASVGPAARCTRILADYGAVVVKVGPVPGRGVEPIVPPPYAYSGARYLKHMAVDLKDAGGREAFLALCRRADVVVESFRPGVLDRLGIGYEDLRSVNPSIILCSTTGYGQDGPRSGWAGHDIDYLAVGGYLGGSQPTAAGGPPLPGATVADSAGGGMHAALAVLAALYGRHDTGTGAHLDVSIADGVLWLTSLSVDEHLATGADVGPGTNIVNGRYACYSTYETADRQWLAVGAIEHRFYAALCRVLGCERWIEHQLDDEAQAAIRADFAAAFASRDRRHWLSALADVDGCAAPVLAASDIVRDEQFSARGAFVEVSAPRIGPGSTPSTFRQVAPILAGMERPAAPVVLPDPAASDVLELLTGAGMETARIASLQAGGAVA